MNRIVINEVDNTTNVTELASTDVVYIPGFAVASYTTSVNESGTTVFTAVEPKVGKGIPTLCTSIGEFEKNFGSAPPLFRADQNYPVASTSAAGFSSYAIPSEASGDSNSTVMFAANTPDPSYIMAKELITAGIPVLYERMNTYTDSTATDYDVDISTAYTYFENNCFKYQDDISETDYTKLLDKGTYSVKYITSGGYPVYEYGKLNKASDKTIQSSIAKSMALIAYNRGDCVAFIDHTCNATRTLTGADSIYKNLDSEAITGTVADSFATMFTPSAQFSLANTYKQYKTEASTGSEVITYTRVDEVTNDSTLVMCGSYSYLLALANSIKTNSNWLAISGISRGSVPNIIGLNTNETLSNAIADLYQKETTEAGISINPITNIASNGLTIWGNRTIVKVSQTGTAFATRFLHIRNMVSDIKKQAFYAAQSLMFEQNNDVLWLNFKALLTPLLDSMITGYGIEDYKIIKKTPLDKTKLSATITIKPVYAVESFEIDIILTDTDLTVSE